jgi:TM2 domain-containing membrane protein YozV
MNDDILSILISGFACVIGLAILGAIIFGLVVAIKRGQEAVQRNEAMINQIMINIPQDKQMVFMMQYSNVKKDPTTAALLALFLGGLGAYHFYMGNTGLGILYLVFVWTYIPSIIAFFELFGIAGKVSEYNRQKAMELAAIFGR